MKKLYGTYFYGNDASDYAKENGYLDYATLAKAFDAVLNNDIISNTYDIGYWEQESGFADNSEEIDELNEKIDLLEERYYECEDTDEGDIEKEELENQIEEIKEKISDLENEDSGAEIFQYYIVSEQGAEILKEINEIVFYNETLDMYVWGVTHWGTSWAYVLTDIKLNCGEEAWNS